ncbi:MAG: M28 family peptidase [Bacteroidales bacterium]|nr:M28 family peptidase [Bacteroidales bacterium]
MKKILFFTILIINGLFSFAQAPHIYEHTYPVLTEENPQIRALMDMVSIDSLTATIEHLSSYHTRRYDSRFIYDVQDWLMNRYETLNLDTVYLHDFQLHGLGITETADNVIAIQRGTLYPDEYVVCGAHYDSYAYDGYDPDTITSPGADDNATGVAGIWETARLLSHYKFDRSIIYCNFNAEECGLLGSAAFAKDCAEQRMDIVGYFNMDMNGYLEEGSDIHVHLLYTTRDSIIADFFYNFCEVYYPEMPIRQAWMEHGDSDYSSFNRNGYAALHPFEDVHASSPFIHSRLDVMGLSVNNMEQSKRFAELNLGAVAILAGLNTSSVEENENTDLALYPNPVKDQLKLFSMEGLNSVKIYNNLGQQIFSEALNGTETFTLDVSGFHKGLYVVSVTTAYGMMSKTIVVE